MAADERERVSRYQRNAAVLAAKLGTEDIALLDAARENYFGLSGPANRIWELLERPATIAEICDTLVAEYDVEPAVCAEQCREFIEELLVKKIVTRLQE